MVCTGSWLKVNRGEQYCGSVKWGKDLFQYFTNSFQEDSVFKVEYFVINHHVPSTQVSRQGRKYVMIKFT